MWRANLRFNQTSAWLFILLMLVAVVMGSVISKPATAANVHINTIDAGAVVKINGVVKSADSTTTFADGDTVTFETTFNGRTAVDTIESWYDISVNIHARHYDVSPNIVWLDEDFSYADYNIYVLDSTDTADFYLTMKNKDGDNPVKIIGLHAFMPIVIIDELRNNDSLVDPEISWIVYGTLENDGNLALYRGGNFGAGSVSASKDKSTKAAGSGAAGFFGFVETNVIINNLIGNSVYLSNADWAFAENDFQIQQLQAANLQLLDQEASVWQMSLGDQFFVDDFDGYSVNDELPAPDQLADNMVWFKARNAAKWNLYPTLTVDGENPNSWAFDNYNFGDYILWETRLANDFFWDNDDNNPEYAHFLGPVNEMDNFEWNFDSFGDSQLYINFFVDNITNYYDYPRFEGDTCGGGGEEWRRRLVEDYGFSEIPNIGFTAAGEIGPPPEAIGSIYSPTSVLRLREGNFIVNDYSESYGPLLSITDNQDLLILSDTDTINFEGLQGIGFNQGINSHWVVEDGLTYLNDTPNNPAMTITTSTIEMNGNSVNVTAANSYAGFSDVSVANGFSGDSTVSTMYVAYRDKSHMGRQLTRRNLVYNSNAGLWNGTIANLPAGEYDFYVVAVENSTFGNLGKVREYSISFAADQEDPSEFEGWDWEGGQPLSGRFMGGDSRDDLIAFYGYENDQTKIWGLRSRGDSLALPRLLWDSGPGNWTGKATKVLAGDFDGDLETDIIGFYAYAGDQTRAWFFKGNGGAGFDDPVVWWDSGAGNWNGEATKFIAGDFDNNGTQDVMAVYAYAGDQTRAWFFGNNGAGFDAPVVWWDSGAGNWNGEATKVLAGDFDGDGATDIVGFYSYGGAQTRAWFFESNGSGFEAPDIWWDSAPGNWEGNAQQLSAGDFDGDGKFDVGSLYSYSGSQSRIFIFANGTDKLAAPAQIWDSGPGNWDGNATRIVSGDMDGDDTRSSLYGLYKYGPHHTGVWSMGPTDLVATNDWKQEHGL